MSETATGPHGARGGSADDPRGTRAPQRLAALQRLGVVTTAATLLLVALGGLVRGTHNGLACPDWPRCYGQWIPRQADLPPGLTLWNVWVEHTHRLVAMVVGLLIAAIAFWVIARYRNRPSVLWPAVAAGVAVNVQAALGAFVVLQLLLAELVTAHLGMALLIVGCLVYLTVTVSLPRRPAAAYTARDLAFARTAALIAGLALVQALVGAHVTGVGAGLAYTGFPLYSGALIPEVGGQREVYHLAHRLLAYLLAGGVAYLYATALRYRRQLQAERRWSDARRWLVTLPLWAAALTIVQIGLGAANLFTELSPWTVTPHLAVASWIWTLLMLTAVLAYRLAPPAGAASPRSAAEFASAVAAGPEGSQ